MHLQERRTSLLMYITKSNPEFACITIHNNNKLPAKYYESYLNENLIGKRLINTPPGIDLQGLVEDQEQVAEVLRVKKIKKMNISCKYLIERLRKTKETNKLDCYNDFICGGVFESGFVP